MPQASRQALHGLEPRRGHRQDHRSINVPLAPVTNGLSRRLADTPHRRSASIEAGTAQLPKLTVPGWAIGRALCGERCKVLAELGSGDGPWIVTCFPSISRALRVSFGNDLRPPLTLSLRKHSGQKPRARQRAWPGYGAIPCKARLVTGQIPGAAGRRRRVRPRPTGKKCRSQPGGAYAPIPRDDQHQGDEDLENSGAPGLPPRNSYSHSPLTDWRFRTGNTRPHWTADGPSPAQTDSNGLTGQPARDYGSAPGNAGAAPYRREKWLRYRP